MLIDNIGLHFAALKIACLLLFDDTLGVSEWQDEITKNALYEIQNWALIM